MIPVFAVVQKDGTNELFNCIYVRLFNRNVYWRDYNVNGCAFLLRPAELDRVIEEKLAAVRRDIVQNFSGVHTDFESELGRRVDADVPDALFEDERRLDDSGPEQ